MRGGGCGGVIYRSLISGGSGNLLVRGFMRTELRRSGIVHAEPHERQEITSSPPDAVATLTDMDLHFSHRRTSGSVGDSLSTEREHDAITACGVQFRARKTSHRENSPSAGQLFAPIRRATRSTPDFRRVPPPGICKIVTAATRSYLDGVDDSCMRGPCNNTQED
jgi:hypothetical protein